MEVNEGRQHIDDVMYNGTYDEGGEGRPGTELVRELQLSSQVRCA